MHVSCRWCMLLCKWRSVWSRHDGHCDEATPDERAPFRVWSFLFSGASLKAKGPGRSRASAFSADRLEVHTAAWRHGRHRFLLLRHLGDHRLGCDQKAGNGRRILDRRTHNLSRVDDALRHKVAVLAVLRIEAVGVLILLQQLADHDRAVSAGIGRDLAGWRLDRLTHDVDAVLLVFILDLEALECLDRAQQGDTAAR